MPSRSVTVAATTTKLLDYNNRRTTVSIFNNDSADVFISEDETGILAEGYIIQSGGALDLIRPLGDTPQNLLFAISAAGGADVRILEQFGELPPLEEPLAVLTPLGEDAT